MSYVISNLVLLNGHQPERFFFLSFTRVALRYTLLSIPLKGFNEPLYPLSLLRVLTSMSTPETPLRWRLNKYGDFKYYISLNEIFEILGIFYLILYFPHLSKKCIKIQSYLSHVTEEVCWQEKKDRVFLCWIFNIVEILSFY